MVANRWRSTSCLGATDVPNHNIMRFSRNRAPLVAFGLPSLHVRVRRGTVLAAHIARRSTTGEWQHRTDVVLCGIVIPGRRRLAEECACSAASHIEVPNVVGEQSRSLKMATATALDLRIRPTTATALLDLRAILRGGRPPDNGVPEACASQFDRAWHAGRRIRGEGERMMADRPRDAA